MKRIMIFCLVAFALPVFAEDFTAVQAAVDHEAQRAIAYQAIAAAKVQAAVAANPALAAYAASAQQAGVSGVVGQEFANYQGALDQRRQCEQAGGNPLECFNNYLAAINTNPLGANYQYLASGGNPYALILGGGTAEGAATFTQAVASQQRAFVEQQQKAVQAVVDHQQQALGNLPTVSMPTDAQAWSEMAAVALPH